MLREEDDKALQAIKNADDACAAAGSSGSKPAINPPAGRGAAGKGAGAKGGKRGAEKQPEVPVKKNKKELDDKIKQAKTALSRFQALCVICCCILRTQI